MTHNTEPSPESLDGLIARTLAERDTDASAAARSVLARIGGRTPSAIAEDLTHTRLRMATAIAAVVLACLCWLPDPRLDRAPRRPLDVTVLAVEDPDTDLDARSTQPHDLVAELFTLTAEAPE